MKFLRILAALIGLLAGAQKAKPKPPVEPEPVIESVEPEEPLIVQPCADQTPHPAHVHGWHDEFECPGVVEVPPIDYGPPSWPPALRMFDISNFWLPTIVTDEEAIKIMQQAKDEGWDGVAALALWPSLTKQQLMAASHVGLFTDLYAFPTWGDPEKEMYRVRNSWQAPAYVWVDLEDQDEDLNGYETPEQIEAWIDGFVARLRIEGYTTGTYSNRYWLDTYLPGVDISKWGPFWLADPDGTPELEDWEPRNGIVRPTWTQYEFNAPVGKMHTDYNAWTLF